VEQFSQRMICYDNVLAVLKELGLDSTQGPLSNFAFHTLVTALEFDDSLFHTHLYDWLLTHNRTGYLLEIQSPYIEDYLKQCTLLDGTRDVLWRYYVKIDDFGNAAEELGRIAESSRYKLDFESRLEYLSLAVSNAKSYPAGSDPKSENGRLLIELEEKLEVGNIQLDILQHLKSAIEGCIRQSENGSVDATTRQENRQQAQALEVMYQNCRTQLLDVNSVSSFHTQYYDNDRDPGTQPVFLVNISSCITRTLSLSRCTNLCWQSIMPQMLMTSSTSELLGKGSLQKVHWFSKMNIAPTFRITDVFLLVVFVESEDSGRNPLTEIEVRVKDLGRRFYPSAKVTPISVLVQTLERYPYLKQTARYQASPGWAVRILREIGFPIEAIFDSFHGLIETRKNEWIGPRASLFLIQDIEFLLRVWLAESHGTSIITELNNELGVAEDEWTTYGSGRHQSQSLSSTMALGSSASGALDKFRTRKVEGAIQVYIRILESASWTPTPISGAFDANLGGSEQEVRSKAGRLVRRLQAIRSRLEQLR